MSTVGDNCAVKIAIREGYIHQKDDSDDVIIYPSQSKNVIIVDERPFTFDHVLEPTVSQKKLFDDLIKPLVARAKLGFNCTVLAYGQTGTGKSYTMGLNWNNVCGEHAGIIPRCLKELFKIDMEESNQKREISVSFIEIYNEKVYDMLSENFAKPLEKRGCRYTGGTCKYLNNIQDCENILMQGIKNRHVRPTKMNTQSSRSHAIFTIHIQTVSGERCTRSCLNLVDLAGSEGVRRTGHQGMAMSEGVNINQGLLCIGKVLDALTEGNKVIPYRDSALSLVLQDSLNSNSYVTLLACISSRRKNLSETLATLRFAKKAKHLKQSPHINVIMAEIKDKTKTSSSMSFHKSGRPNRGACGVVSKMSLQATASSTKKNGVQHGNTFCTPNKKRANSAKINKTSIEPGCSSDIILDSTIESRNSLMSVNMSSSTTINYTPIVRKCIIEMMKPVMDYTIRQTFATLTKEFKNCDLNRRLESEVKPAAPNHLLSTESGRKLSTEKYGQDLNRLLTKLLTEANTKDEQSDDTGAESDSTLCMTPNKQKFTTSSPVFKMPSVPKQPDVSYIKYPRSEYSVKGQENDEDGLDELSDQSITYRQTFFVDDSKGVDGIPKFPRRSQRISQRSRTQLTLNTSNTSISSMGGSRRTLRRSSRRCGTQLHDESRRKMMTMLEKKPYTAVKESGSKPKSIRKTVKSRDKDPIDNSEIGEYFSDNDGHNVAPVYSNKKQNISKHRESMLHLLNTGSMKALQILPQIGPKTAYQIVTHRTLNGKFKSLAHVAKLPLWRGKSWERFAEANYLL